jgi:hypothetical protein
VKKSCYLFFIIVLVMVSRAFASASCIDEGTTLRCHGGIVESIDYRGDVVLDGTTVLDKIKTMGDLTAKNATMNRINIVGDVTTVNSVISGNAIIVGSIRSRATKFDSPVRIVGDADFDFCEFHTDVMLVGDVNASQTWFRGSVVLGTYASYFTHVSLNDLTVKKQSRDVQQIIYLKEGTGVDVVTFTSGRGLIELSGGSRVTGKVVGAKINNQSL